jgi:serine/threonine-protein kinase
MARPIRARYKEVFSGDGSRSDELQLMQIPDPVRTSERSESQGSMAEPPANAGGLIPGSEPATVVRTSSSSARRLQSLALGSPPTPPVPLPSAGDLIGTFLLEESIGVGGMGAVYRARDTQLDREVALKLLPPDQTGDPEIVQRFYQEGRSAAQLDHENIARVYSIGQDGLNHFIAFEFIEGTTVRRRVDESGPLPVSKSVDITLQIAQALVHAAGRGVVHRDIKPSNIILTPQGRAKLVDMGLARRFEREVDHGLTQSGMTLGTFDYISPEQARDPRDVDVRSDLYSLGCTLFHMLTGRPPFPGGTVLQKLLQHQEEPPPDVRSLNPAVPAELTRIIAKLMAKDRDRRYQSPEQLVRDLLVIAGQLGLTVIPAEQQLSMVAGHRVTWERHLVWFFPALAFVVVVIGLVWWGRELNNPVALDPGLGSTRLPRHEATTKTRSSSAATPATAPAFMTDTELDPSPAAASLSRNILVRPSDDLLTSIATAPPRSIITLCDDGPYLLGSRTAEFRAVGALLNRDLTIRAESGVRPVLRFAADAGMGDGTLPALLPFVGGNVTIEGLTFEFDREGPDDRIAALSSEDTELTIRGCMFRQSPVHAARYRAALRLRVQNTRPASGDRPPAVLIDACHFDGGQVGIVAEGPADILIRDCTMGPGSPSIWIDNSRSSVLVPTELRLWNSSLIGGSGPILEIEGTLARILVNDTVVAPSGGTQVSLVAIDDPRNLAWHGRSNLYSRIRAYLEPTGGIQSAERIVDFAHWKDASSEIREVDSVLAATSVWNSPQPLQDLVIERDNPTQAFQLSDTYSQSMICGARQGPYGARLFDPVRLARRAPPGSPGGLRAAVEPPSDQNRSPDDQRPLPGSPKNSADLPTPNAPNVASATEKTVADAAIANDDETSNLPAMPPMGPTPAIEAGNTSAADAGPEATEPKPAARREERPAGRSKDSAREGVAPAGSQPPRGSRDEEGVIRSSEQFVSQLNRLSNGGGTLTIARQADLALPTTDFSGSGHWAIRAQPGSERPRLRFRPSGFAARSLTDWAVLFNLRGGSLDLKGLDILIQEQDAGILTASRLAAIGVTSGSKLTLTDCTITVTGRYTSSAAVVVQQGLQEATNSSGDHPPRSASVQADNTFLRCVGDGITVTPDRSLDLRLRNVVIATEGSMLHALGNSQPTVQRGAIKVKLERALTRTRSGLVFLESTQDEVEPPVAEIEAESSIVSTAGPGALLRVNGRQGQIEQLRDRIVWKADRVAYDQITIYRRDQVLQTGVSPRDYTRADWQNAFDPTDESPRTDGVRFHNKVEPSRSAWTLTKDDVRLDPRSPVADRGPDLSQIPSPPAIGF